MNNCQKIIQDRAKTKGFLSERKVVRKRKFRPKGSESRRINIDRFVYL